RVGGDIAVVDVHHVWRFNEGMREVLISRVERVINLERAARLREEAQHTNIPGEVAGITAGAQAPDSESGSPVIRLSDHAVAIHACTRPRHASHLSAATRRAHYAEAADAGAFHANIAVTKAIH